MQDLNTTVHGAGVTELSADAMSRIEGGVMALLVLLLGLVISVGQDIAMNPDAFLEGYRQGHG